MRYVWPFEKANFSVISFENYLSHLIIPACPGNSEIRVYCIRSIVQNFLSANNLSFRTFSDLSGIKYSDVLNWFSYSSNDVGTPLSKLVAINSTFSICNDLFDKITYFGNTNSKKYFLPKTITPQLAYLLGYLMGDGHLSNSSDLIRNGSLYNAEIRITTGNNDHLIFLREIFFNLFHHRPPLFSEGNFYRLVCRSKVIHLFLSRVCGIPVGNKKELTHIPEIVNSDPLLQRFFVSGFFDADGSICFHKGKLHSIRLKQHNRLILEQCQKVFESAGITRSKIYVDNGCRNGVITYASVLVISNKSDIIRFINSFFSLKVYDKGVRLALAGVRPDHIAIIPDGKETLSD